MNLVLVESPTKAKTLSRYLGNGYMVEATMGHVRDLPENKVGVSVVEAGGKYEFRPDYVMTPKQRKRMDELKKGAAAADIVYLATDPDREGEAIAYHAAELLKGGKGKTKTGAERFKRIVFHEITKNAVEEAMAHPRGLDLGLVGAQQARRVVDRLVGYKLSPILWKKVRRGLSAGRVQSVALRLVVEREREIEAFKPEEYWDVTVILSKADRSWQVTAKLVAICGEKAAVKTEAMAREIAAGLEIADYWVETVEKKSFSRTPPAPFTTSTMQQAAANKMGWSAKKTMQVAQSLYEEGYITYHRTDSTNIASEAAYAAKVRISKTFGSSYALAVPRFFKTKSKVAQEAHEAIRPTDVEVTQLREGSNRDQQRLYEMIWKRFVACQMEEAAGVSVKVGIVGAAGERRYGFEARGEVVAFDGWYKVLGRDAEECQLSELIEGEKLGLLEVKPEQKFTQPPPRYNDASLIKALEEMGVGRPSTYAPIISTIQDRNYAEKVEKRFKPTSLGVAVNDFLVVNFPKIVDYGFTASMEDSLDEIANGKREWQPVVGEFYGPFEKQLENVDDNAARVQVASEETGEDCPECRRGRVVIRVGKFGRFLACSRYPECRYKANWQNKIGVKCPKCADGDVILRQTRFKKSFYGCSNYPKCDFASWNKPAEKLAGDER